jgi:hypothetical protein
MSISNHERVNRALNLLREGLYPYVERELRETYGNSWLSSVAADVSDECNGRRTNGAKAKKTAADILQQDVSILLKVMWSQWNEVFKKSLGRAERSLVSELRDTRNHWAHNGTISSDDTYRALDSVTRLLAAVSAPQADDVEKLKLELLRTRFAEQARHETRRAAVAPVDGTPSGSLKPWREIVTPHEDVASGRYQQAEFAADLWQVYNDEGSDEYRLPTEFFRRTYLTEGLRQLLTGALLRLSGRGGDPVIELQTNFGGGKTHAMLALYHLCFGVRAQDLPGLEPVFQQAGVTAPPSTVNTAVLVGHKISPGQPQTKKDGTIVRTLWGELAWQLGGREGYEFVRAADETGTNPGDTLKTLFNHYAPCLILIDEWVAYARQLHEGSDLPAGSFDTHFTFAQTLSESAKNADRTLLVVSIPASDIEIGGDRGRDALIRLKNAIGRVESPWRPANAEESFEIVRRRLFQPITEPSLFVARDVVIRAFSEMYRQQAQEFPLECREADYERRLTEAYPIHPEVFDRLYSDWSSLDKFQRTRGVLRLMAKVIHSLWEKGDKNLIIMPANISMDDPQVQSELTRYLDDQWQPVIDKDVDGPNSLPVSLDKHNPNLGRYSACRRVTRTIYLGSAPGVHAANRGVEDRRIKLGCVQPGESVATFGDALRRLTDQSTYLYVDGNRYWISTQPNVTRTAQDRASQILADKDRVWAEIVSRLKADRQRGEFTGVHIAPESTADIPDDASMGVRLVVLGPQYPHISRASDTPARQQVAEILQHRGGSPRYFKNLLVFLAPAQSKISSLEQEVSQYLAWNSIVRDAKALNLDGFQSNQATTKQKNTDESVTRLVGETYQWLLVPDQPDPQGEIEWLEMRLQGQESPILRASRKLVHEEQLIVTYAASRLCLEALNPYLWKDSNHIDLKKLWEYLASYLYLPRLKNEQVLLQAIRDGVADSSWQEYFAYAEGWNETDGKYSGLKTGAPVEVKLSSQSFLVKPEVARKQMDVGAIPNQSHDVSGEDQTDPSDNSKKDTDEEKVTVEPFLHKRFYGSVKLNPVRLKRDVDQIADEVLQHLTGLVGADAKITLEIDIRVPTSIPENVVRTVTENSKVIGFHVKEFE